LCLANKLFANGHSIFGVAVGVSSRTNGAELRRLGKLRMRTPSTNLRMAGISLPARGSVLSGGRSAGSSHRGFGVFEQWKVTAMKKLTFLALLLGFGLCLAGCEKKAEEKPVEPAPPAEEPAP
jgi:hypothetical protein